MTEFSKSEYKILKLLYKNGPIKTATEDKMIKKKPHFKDAFIYLRQNKYIERTPDISNHIIVGTKDELRITSKGCRAYEMYKEEHRVFSKRVIATQIIIPVIVTLLTNVVIFGIRQLLPLIQQLLISYSTQ